MISTVIIWQCEQWWISGWFTWSIKNLAIELEKKEKKQIETLFLFHGNQLNSLPQSALILSFSCQCFYSELDSCCYYSFGIIPNKAHYQWYSNIRWHHRWNCWANVYYDSVAASRKIFTVHQTLGIAFWFWIYVEFQAWIHSTASSIIVDNCTKHIMNCFSRNRSQATNKSCICYFWFSFSLLECLWFCCFMIIFLTTSVHFQLLHVQVEERQSEKDWKRDRDNWTRKRENETLGCIFHVLLSVVVRGSTFHFNFCT